MAAGESQLKTVGQHDTRRVIDGLHMSAQATYATFVIAPKLLVLEDLCRGGGPILVSTRSLLRIEEVVDHPNGPDRLDLLDQRPAKCCLAKAVELEFGKWRCLEIAASPD